VLAGFDDLDPEQWQTLLRLGDTDVVYLTRAWQRAWWETLGEGRLLLTVAERGGRVIALAPFMTANGMIYFVGTGEADYLDFLGDVGDPKVLDSLLATARDSVPDFQGFKLYGLLNVSRTGQRLQEAAPRLGLEAMLRGAVWPAPVIDLQFREAWQAVNKRSLRKRDRYFDQRGWVVLRQSRDGEEVFSQLEEFFAQHVTRWGVTSYSKKERSINFLDPAQQAFYQRLTREAGPDGWLRFSRLEWEGRAIAFEFGYRYGDTYLGGPSSFAADLARHSPGQVLLRRLLLAAIDEGVRHYDLGIGDEPYKLRFPVRFHHTHCWGLYPP
jgi:CelD/BcsL family acetyltransferase involved in cellulose biosynthesis